MHLFYTKKVQIHLHMLWQEEFLPVCVSNKHTGQNRVICIRCLAALVWLSLLFSIPLLTVFLIFKANSFWQILDIYWTLPKMIW